MTGLNDANLKDAEIVAHAGSPKRSRWTELRIFFTPDRREPFIAEVRGCTRMVGEHNRVRRWTAWSIDDAIARFDRDSSLTSEIVTQAQRWALRNAERLLDLPDGPKMKTPVRTAREAFYGEGGIVGALEWLFPEWDEQEMRVVAFAAAFGIPVNRVKVAVRACVAGSEPQAWVKAFLGALLFFDRDAFKRGGR